MNAQAIAQKLTCKTCGISQEFPSKNSAKRAGWLKNDGVYCPACAVDVRVRMAEEAVKRQRADEAREYERWLADVDEKEAWPGNGHVARWIEGRLKKAGVRFSRIDALGGSVYIELYDSSDDYCGKLRIADHRSPAGGGYNVEKQKRSGEADIDCNPHSSIDWKAATSAAVELTKG